MRGRISDKTGSGKLMMETNRQINTIVFEPWSLGDAVIAGRVAQQLQNGILQVNPKWTSLLAEIYPKLHIRTVDLPYTKKGKRWSGVRELKSILTPDPGFSGRIISIRGDVRDRRAAHVLYPHASIIINGFGGFLSRRMCFLNLPFKWNMLPVKNRYIRWSKSLRVSLPDEKVPLPTGKRILLHPGAQWLSRRYPWISELREILLEKGMEVFVVLSPNDPPVEDLLETNIHRLADADLVRFIRNGIDFVVANDSAPMHIAAALGLPTVVFSALSDIREWIPPGRILVLEKTKHLGYRPKREYMQDHLIMDETLWIRPEEAVAHLQKEGWIAAPS